MDAFQKKIIENINCHISLFDHKKKIEFLIKKIFTALKRGKKLMICGNGGSAADAQHIAAEFLVRLRPKINRKPLPVISLAQDTSTLTACANDYGFDFVFSRNFEALYNVGDILIIISTSGNSKNINEVLRVAKRKKAFTVGLLGSGGGSAKKLVKLPIVINSNVTARIQECHIFLAHFIFEEVENLLFNLK